MGLLRVAFTGNDSVIRITVLCPGCYQELVKKLTPSIHRWAKDLVGISSCEFCMGEARQAFEELR